MTHEPRRRVCHTEHDIWDCWVGPDNARYVRLFGAPTVLDGSGTYKRLPHEVKWTDVRKGDVVLALMLDEEDGDTTTIDVLQFWHVLEVDEDTR